MTIFILLVGSFLAALVSGAAGFGGSLLLLPVATAMHSLKTIIYSQLTNMNYCVLLIK